jgi:hypothetical protein
MDRFQRGESLIRRARISRGAIGALRASLLTSQLNSAQGYSNPNAGLRLDGTLMRKLVRIAPASFGSLPV